MFGWKVYFCLNGCIKAYIMLHLRIYTLPMYTNADMCEHACYTKSNKRQSFTTHIKIGEMYVCMSKYEKNAWSLIHLTNKKQKTCEKKKYELFMLMR